jgi:hypothetical protein
MSEPIDPERALDRDVIVGDARDAAQAPDWDEGDIDEALGVLVDALESEARLSDSGRVAAGQRIRNLVKCNAQVCCDTDLYPEIVGERIEAPIIITGFPRSGTTFLHALLAADPAHRAPQWWESLRPSPPPDLRTYETDPRRDVTAAEIEHMLNKSTGLISALPYAVDMLAECNTLCQTTLRSQAFPSHFHVPSYQAWYLDHDQSPMYRYHRRVLQQLQWRGPKGRWVLKSPAHMLTMAEAANEYPDATFVVIHRDPLKIVASAASLYQMNRVIYSDEADPAETGRESLQKWVEAAGRMEAFRSSGSGVPMFDVTYEELVADPAGTTRGLYELIGIEYTAATEAVVQRTMEANARGRRPEHKYVLEEVGLTEADVRDALGSYRPTSSLR